MSRHFLFVPAGKNCSEFAPVKFHRRGLFHLRETELQTRFPFSFFVKIKRNFVNQQVVVYPAIYRLSEELMSQIAGGLVFESPYRGDSQQLLHLRDYAPLDSSKRIHWKASAKAERLLVKEFQKEQGRDIYFYFDCFPHSPEVDLFEKGISLVASFAYFLTEKGIPGKFLFPDRTFSLVQGQSMTPLLNYLAGLKTGKIQWTNTDEPSILDALVFALRSKAAPSILARQWPGMKVLWIEDWVGALIHPRSVS